MKHNSTGRKPPNMITRLLDRLERRLFVVDDAAALAKGWEVRRTATGRGRVYRDPRWDLISECASCTGNGLLGARGCRPCGGRGTVRLDRAPADEASAGAS